ncbi:MAG: hypothetical protein ACOYYS_19340 [Chloroflexota bacterium]
MMSSTSINVQLNIVCQLSSEKVGALEALVRELLALVNPETLRYVLIVPDNEFETAVNNIIEMATDQRNSYKHKISNPARAIAIPVEIGEELNCFVVIGESILQNIEPDHYHPYELVSSLLEEFLHVWYFTITWKRRGYVQHRQGGLDACTAALFTIADQMQSEYVVNRKKAYLAGTNHLFEVERGGELVTGQFRYGDSVSKRLDNAIKSLGKTVIGAATKEITISDAWLCLVNDLYRDILEPLARDAAFRTGTTDEHLTEKEALESKFYKDHFDVHWRKIRSELQRTMNSELKEADLALDEIVKTLRIFLECIGVTYRKTDDDRCWVDFRTNFFDALSH